MPDPTSPTPTRLHGKLLLADPSLRAGIFGRSVILLHDHDPAEGAMGLILNRPTGKLLGEFLESSEFDALRSLPVHLGGPVDGNQLTFASFWWSPRRGMRWALRISVDHAAEEMRRPGRLVRAFIGYSGWSAGQLEEELQQPAWIPVEPRATLLGQPHNPQLWSALLRELSPRHRLMAMTPEDPFLN